MTKKILLFIAALLLTSNLLLGQKKGVLADEIVAKVDNYIILKSDIEKAYQSIKTNGQTPRANERCEILKGLIVNKILVAKAEIDSVIVEETQVNAQLDRRMQYFIQQFGSVDKLEKTLGKSVPQLKESLREQIKEQLILQKMQGEITANIKITPNQVRKYFSKMPKDSIPFLAAEVEVGQIVKYPEISKKEKQKAKEQLISIKNQVLAGADFAKLAKSYSVDYGTAAKGGDLDWQGRGVFASEFEAAALSLDINEISAPVETEFGIHLIQLLGRRGNQFHSRHILIRPKSTSLDIQDAEHFLDSLRGLILLDSTTFERAAMKFSDDKATRPNAGYFKDENTGSTAISTESLETSIFFTIDTMKVATLSKPMRFRTLDGKDAVRLLFYKSNKPPHYANMKDDYQKIQIAAKRSKENDAVEKWLKKAKADVFVEVDKRYDKCGLKDDL